MAWHLWFLYCLAFVGTAYGCGSVNGEEAIPHSFPWQVSLQTPTGFHYCGGSLINENWVVTSASCPTTVHNASALVILGGHDLTSNAEDIQTIKIGKAFKHPRYGYPYLVENNIQLIKLASPAKLGPRVSPVCVAETSDNLFPVGMCLSSGCFDSGNPLVCEKDGAWTLAGVVSWSSCGPSDMPELFASIPEMRSWMDQTIAAN